MVLHARLPSLLLVFFLAAPAFAQPTLSIHQPTLTVNSRHVEVEGAPLSQVPFTYFFLNVPKVGEFIIAAHRFEGSTKAGLFNGGYLEFELAGSHVQLWSSATILNIHDIVDAYVRLDDHVARDGDIARLSLTSSGQPAQQVAERRDVSTNQEARYIPIEGNRSDLSRQVDQLRDQSSMLTSQIERLRAEKAYLETQLTTDQSLADSLRRELTTQRVALETSNGDLESEVDQLRRQNAELLQRVRSLRAEVERHDRERGGLRVEREAIASVRQANRQPESVQTLTEERDEYAVTVAALRREIQALEERQGTLESERDFLLAERAMLTSDRDQLRQERDALHREAENLRERLEGGENSSSSVLPDHRDLETPRIELPGFDFDRLANANEIRDLLATTEYPDLARSTGVEGRVTVLLATDPTGQVVETAVLVQGNSQLDEIAERIVRVMQFRPLMSDGAPAGLRSQVTVLFVN